MLDRSCDLCGEPGIVHGGLGVSSLTARTPRRSAKVHIYTFRISTRSRAVFVCAWCVRSLEELRTEGRSFLNEWGRPGGV